MLLALKNLNLYFRKKNQYKGLDRQAKITLLWEHHTFINQLQLLIEQMLLAKSCLADHQPKVKLFSNIKEKLIKLWCHPYLALEMLHPKTY